MTLLEDHRRKIRHGASVAATASAKARQCPACQRKGALKRRDDEMGMASQCRWCHHEEFLAWQDAGLLGPPQTGRERIIAEHAFAYRK